MIDGRHDGYVTMTGSDDVLLLRGPAVADATAQRRDQVMSAIDERKSSASNTSPGARMPEPVPPGRVRPARIRTAAS
ncbi:hypothetical protein ACFW7J_39235, partial [Streptomyces sp. NPDC059525]|uniref:hypothetical protein n=1 Tax=Streptomyces sp. NPDC059525 TaxID=3346857 RepID=UPI0036A5E19E